VGMLFLPHDAAMAELIHNTFEQIVKDEGLKVLGWRSVPVKPEVLGPLAKQYQPLIEQLLVESAGATGDELERQLYLIRRQVLHAMAKLIANHERFTPEQIQKLKEFYVCSFSCRTIVYKGMVRSAVLAFFMKIARPRLRQLLRGISPPL
jgi:glutamate synthase (ferredoxin)